MGWPRLPPLAWAGPGWPRWQGWARLAPAPGSGDDRPGAVAGGVISATLLTLVRGRPRLAPLAWAGPGWPRWHGWAGLAPAPGSGDDRPGAVAGGVISATLLTLVRGWPRLAPLAWAGPGWPRWHGWARLAPAPGSGDDRPG